MSLRLEFIGGPVDGQIFRWRGDDEAVPIEVAFTFWPAFGKEYVTHKYSASGFEITETYETQFYEPTNRTVEPAPTLPEDARNALENPE